MQGAMHVLGALFRIFCALLRLKDRRAPKHNQLRSTNPRSNQPTRSAFAGQPPSPSGSKETTVSSPPTVRPLWTITWMTRRTWTRTTCRIEHTCTLSVVALCNHSSHHMAQAARTCLSQSSHPWTCAVFLECFLSITLYLLPFLYFFLPFLMTDGDSVTINNLRNSANGTFVTLDDYLPLTLYFSITCAEEAQHLQLEPWAPTSVGRRF